MTANAKNGSDAASAAPASTVVPDAERPIFLLGTGRCGSTYLQRLLCSTEQAWIWGEHDGILGPFGVLMPMLEGKGPVSQFHLDRARPFDRSSIATMGAGDATGLAWMNGFTRDDMLRAFRGFIIGLLGAGLPEGKTRWGFKEIRYGAASRLPELLLLTFPHGHVVYTVRRAASTVSSNLLSWNIIQLRGLVAGNTDTAELDQLYDGYAERWLECSAHYLTLGRRYPGRVPVSRLEDSVAQLPQLLATLGLDPGCAPALASQRLNENESARAIRHEPAVLALLESGRARYQDRFAAMERDLGYPPSP